MPHISGQNFSQNLKKEKIDIEKFLEYDIIILKSSGCSSAVIKKG